jgi:hypothetical protein
MVPSPSFSYYYYYYYYYYAYDYYYLEILEFFLDIILTLKEGKQSSNQ